MGDELVVGFFHEASGERSMTRLLAFAMACGVLLLVLAAVVVGIRGGAGAPAVIAALAAPAAPLAAGIWAALRERR